MGRLTSPLRRQVQYSTLPVVSHQVDPEVSDHGSMRYGAGEENVKGMSPVSPVSPALSSALVTNCWESLEGWQPVPEQPHGLLPKLPLDDL